MLNLVVLTSVDYLLVIVHHFMESGLEILNPFVNPTAQAAILHSMSPFFPSSEPHRTSHAASPSMGCSGLPSDTKMRQTARTFAFLPIASFPEMCNRCFHFSAFCCVAPSAHGAALFLRICSFCDRMACQIYLLWSYISTCRKHITYALLVPSCRSGSITSRG